MKQTIRKLSIRRETILNLGQLRRARGGLPAGSEIHGDCCNTTTNTCGQTDYCPNTGFTCTFAPPGAG